MGFLNVEHIILHLKECFQPIYHISNTNREPILDISEVITFNKTKINKDPVKLQSNFGDAIHVSIGYGCNTEIGGAKHTLFVVDRAYETYI